MVDPRPAPDCDVSLWINNIPGNVADERITLRVDVDRHLGNVWLPETKKLYQTSGTPEVVMIDRQGMIRFQKFGWFDPVAAEKYLDTLLDGTASAKRRKPVEVCLASELCGEL